MAAVASAVQWQPTRHLRPAALRPQREALLAEIGEDPKPADAAAPKTDAGTTDAAKPVTQVDSNVDTKPADPPADTTAKSGDKPTDTTNTAAAAPPAANGDAKPANAAPTATNGDNAKPADAASPTATNGDNAKPADAASPTATTADKPATSAEAPKAKADEKPETKPETTADKTVAENTGMETKKKEEEHLVDLTKEDAEGSTGTDATEEGSVPDPGASGEPLFPEDPAETTEDSDANAESASGVAPTTAATDDEESEQGLGTGPEEPQPEPTTPAEDSEPTDESESSTTGLGSVSQPNPQGEASEESTGEEEAAPESETGVAASEEGGSDEDKPYVPPVPLSLHPSPDANAKPKVPNEFERRMDVLQDLVDRLEDKFLAQYGKNIRPRPRNTKLDAVYVNKIDQLEARILDLQSRLRPNSKVVIPSSVGTSNTADDKRLDSLTRRIAQIDAALSNTQPIRPVPVGPGSPNIDANGDGQQTTVYANNQFPNRRFKHQPKYAPAPPQAPEEPETVDSLKMNDQNAPENMPRDVPEWVSQKRWREPIMKFKQRAGRAARR